MAPKSKKADRKDEQKEESVKCRRCGVAIPPSDPLFIKVMQSGLCPWCTLELARSSDARYDYDVSSFTITSVNLSGVMLNDGDTIEVVVGRNKTVIGKFKAWNPRLYTITIETNDGVMLIPYKYVKLLVKK